MKFNYYIILTVRASKLVRMLVHDGHSVLNLITVIEFDVYRVHTF